MTGHTTMLTERVDKRVDELVASLPPLTDDQIARLRLLFHGAGVYAEVAA